MATVYLAHDQKHHRPVAIKVLRPEFAAALGPERFLLEIETAARLNHPHILPLHDSGEADGLLYFVMPYVEGQTLRGRLDRERQIALEDALQIAREVADALSYAHEHEVVHRDVKPENILFQAGHAVVSDFGIARAIVAAGGDHLTKTGITVGTPAYMSPEQASGDTQLDGRSDVYSLGCVVYEMLAGEPPYTGPTAQAILAKRLSEPLPHLRTVRTVPAPIEWAISTALARSPADRFATAARFREALTPSGAVAPAGSRAAALAAALPAARLDRELAETEARARPIGRGLLAAGLAGLIAFGALYRYAYPPPISAPRGTRGEAVAIGKDFLKAMGAVGSFTEAVQFDGQRDQRAFLEQNLGLPEARRRVVEGLPLGQWRLRWFTPGQVEEWKVAVAHGAVTEFDHVVPEAAPGANLAPEAARTVAESFLLAQGWKLDSLRRVEASSVKRPNRTDHHFDWEKVGSSVPWRSASGAGAEQVVVDIRGDRVGSYRHYFRVPFEFGEAQPKSTQTSAVVGSLFWLGVALALGFAIARSRAGDVRWRPAIALTVAAAGGTAVFQGANVVAAELYNHPAAQSVALFWVGPLVKLLFPTVFFGGVMLLSIAAGESLTRAYLPRSLGGYYPVLRGSLFHPTVTHAIIRGYALGFVLLGVEAAFQLLAARVSGAWFSEDAGYVTALNDALPLLRPLDSAGGAIAIGSILLFGLPLLKRFLKSTVLVTIVAALLAAVFGLVQPSVHPLGLAALRSALATTIVVLGFVRVGVMACVIALYLVAIMPVGVSLLTAGETGLVVVGIVMLMLALVPVAPLARAR